MYEQWVDSLLSDMNNWSIEGSSRYFRYGDINISSSRCDRNMIHSPTPIDECKGSVKRELMMNDILNKYYIRQTRDEKIDQII